MELTNSNNVDIMIDDLQTVKYGCIQDPFG